MDEEVQGIGSINKFAELINRKKEEQTQQQMKLVQRSQRTSINDLKLNQDDYPKEMFLPKPELKLLDLKQSTIGQY